MKESENSQTPEGGKTFKVKVEETPPKTVTLDVEVKTVSDGEVKTINNCINNE